MKHPLPALALIATLAAYPAVAAEGPFPVWLSPSLGIERVEDVPAMLDRPWRLDGPSGDGVFVVKYKAWDVGDGVFLTSRKISTCNELFHASANKYYWGDFDDAPLDRCKLLYWLTKAKPAMTSFVRDFKLDDRTPEVVSPGFMFTINCDVRTWSYFADRKGLSLSEHLRNLWSENDEGHMYPIGDGTEVRLRPGEFYAITDPAKLWPNESNHLFTGELLPPGPERAEYHNLYYVMYAEIFARADFNNDGIEDVMFEIVHRMKERRLGYNEIIALTRSEPGAVLTLANPEEYLAEGCSEHQWQAHHRLRALPPYPPQPWQP